MRHTSSILNQQLFVKDKQKPARKCLRFAGNRLKLYRGAGNMPLDTEGRRQHDIITDRFFVGVVLVSVLLIASAGFMMRQSYVDFQERAEVTTQNLANLLAGELAVIIGKSELALFAVADEFRQQSERGSIQTEEITALMTALQSRLPEIDSLRATDPEGIVKYGLGILPGSRTDLSDRDFFIYARHNPVSRIHIAKPVLARISKKWVLPVALRLNSSDGTFAGVVYANIALDYVNKLFSEIDIGSHGVVALFDSGLSIIARYPSPEEGGSAIGKKYTSSRLTDLIQSGNKSGTYTAHSSLDGIERTFSYLKIAGQPLYVIVGLAKQTYMAGWRKDALVIFGLTILTLLTALLAASLLYRSWREQLETANTLQKSENKYRLLAHEQRVILDTMTLGVWYISHREVQWANSAQETLFGYNAAETQGKNTAMFYADIGSYELVGRDGYAMLATGRSFLIELQMKRKDGSLFWCSLIGRAIDPVKPDDGSIWMFQDITERKQITLNLQEKTHLLENLNLTLEKRVREEISNRMKNEQMLIQQSKLAAMGEMLGAISHQWRQPLNTLGIMVQNLRDAHAYGELDRDYLDNTVQKSMEQIQHMSKTIDDFRSFFLPDKEAVAFDTMEAVGHVLSLFSAQLAANHIDIRLTCRTHGRTFDMISEIVPCPEKSVSGYRNEFEHVMLNLINNAREAILERYERDSAFARGQLNLDFYNADRKVIIRVSDNVPASTKELSAGYLSPTSPPRQQ